MKTKPVTSYLGALTFAVVSTYLLVASGLDWHYFLFTYNDNTRPILFLADGLGFLIPLLLPAFLFIHARKREAGYTKVLAVTVAMGIGFFASMSIKAFTGRMSPPHHGPFDIDISGAFQFGFMEHHIIGGWPSSHAAVMFALATCIFILFPHSRKLCIASFCAALFVGVGVTFGFHWLSEFIAGACLGAVIGHAVGKVFVSRKVAM